MKKKLYFQLLLILGFLLMGKQAFAQIECNPGMVYTFNLGLEGTVIVEAGVLFPDTYSNVLISRGGGDVYEEALTFTCDETGDFFINGQATDGEGNDVDCLVHVIIQDELPPTAVVQADYNILMVAGVAELTAAEINEASQDNCEIVAMTLDQYTFTEAGVYTVTFTVMDASGNSNSAFTTVTVGTGNVDDLTCVNGLAVSLPVFDNQIAIYPDDVINESVSGNLTLSRGNGFAPFLVFTCDDIGEPIEVTIRAEDNGQVAECTTNVTIEDIDSPTLVVNQEIYLLLNEEGEATLTALEVIEDSYDNCSVESITLSQTLFTTADLGENVVVVTAVDASGNFNYAWTTVTVIDGTGCIFPAGIEWPDDITITGNVDPAILTPAYLQSNYGYTSDQVRPVIPVGCEENVAYNYSDQVVFNGTPVTKILRSWTAINWETEEALTHLQLIRIFDTDGILVCLNGLVISTANGPVQVYAFDVLESSSGNNEDLELVINDADGVSVPDNLITSAYAGQTLTYILTDTNTGNSCWGNIIVDAVDGECPIIAEEDINWPLEEITIYDGDAIAADLTPENLVADYGFALTDVNVMVMSDCAVVGVTYNDEVFSMLDGTIRILRNFVVVDWYYYDAPGSLGVWEFAQIIHVVGDSPLLICDVLPHTADVGDCESGHTLDDDVEWPAEISIADHRIMPDELMTYSGIADEDARPIFYNNEEDYTVTYTDLLGGISATELLINRVWLVKNIVYDLTWEYTQTIVVDITNFVNLVTVNTPSARAMPSVWINESIATDENGMAYVDDDFISSISLDDEPGNGINILDLVLANHHILGLNYILSTKRYLADIDEDDSITEADELGIENIILEQQQSPWLFEERIANSNMGPSPKAHFIGYKKGDINDSALLPGEGLPLDDSFEFTFDDLLLNAGENYEIPVYLNQEVAAYGVEYRMTVNEEQLVVTDVTSEYFSGEVSWHSELGQLVVLLHNNEESEVIGGDASNAVLTIHAMAQSNSLLHLAANLEESHSVIATTDYAAIIFDNKIVHFIQTGTEDAYLSVVRVYPNPTSDYIHIDSKDLVLKGDIQFSLYTLSGKQVLMTNNDNDIDISNLVEGLYYYRVVVGEHEIDGKISIMK